MMWLSKIKRIKYFTPDKMALISEENKKLYQKYIMSSTIKNRDTKETTYKVYQNYMNHFLVFLAENYDNISLYSEDFMENAVDILEHFMEFCVSTLNNNKKVINTKLSAISSFYLWSLKRDLIEKHPFDKKLERMKGAKDEKIIASHYLDEEQTDFITQELHTDKRYDIQDRLIWNIMLDSANRVGAIEKLVLSKLNLDEMLFEDIREKRGKLVEVIFEEDTKAIIEEWLEQRKEMDNLEVDALFITKLNGEYRPMSKSTIQSRIKKIGHILGIEDFRSHSIRKTKLNQVYESTGDLSLAASLGNHESVETTRQSYIKPESKAKIREKIRKLKEKNKDKE